MFTPAPPVRRVTQQPAYVYIPDDTARDRCWQHSAAAAAAADEVDDDAFGDNGNYAIDRWRSYAESVTRISLPRKSSRYDTRYYFNVRSKADISQLNLPHGTDN